MNQHDFDALLAKYLSGECTQQEEKQIRDWSDNMLKHSPLEVGEQEKDGIEKRIWDKLDVDQPRRSLLSNNIFRMGIAASLVTIMISVGWLYSYKRKNDKLTSEDVAHVEETLPSVEGNIEVKNTSDKPYELTLDDKSVITLKPQSSLSYPEHFDEKTRKVYLNGEAFFKIQKDPSRPFLVYAGELVTQVLGTSFNVKSFKSAKSIEVAVVTGRVSVYESQPKSSKSRNGIILTPNQKITFDKKSKMLIPELVSEPVIVHPPETKFDFVFDETPISKVISALQDAYGIEIVMETTDLDNCVFTGDINDLTLYSQLKFVCGAVNANYELRGTTFFLNGKGCRDK